jgi:hypothetical protein
MSRYPELPDLLDRYMKAQGSPEQWVTVRSLREFFDLGESVGPALSAFLRKIHHGTYRSCRYQVARIEWFHDVSRPYQFVRRYLVRERPPPKSSHGA